MKKYKIIKTKIIAARTFLIATIALVCLSSNTAYSQKNVTGVVTSSADEFPVIGATVTKVGSNVLTVTDFDGVYSIKAEKGDVLEFSYIGMATQKIKVKGPTLNVVLEQESNELDEVVVIGYGKVKKKEVTGAVAQVKAEQIENFITADLSSALQGQVAGLNVNTNSGQPGEPSSISIRGVSSLTGTNNPLYVVDGIPYDEDPNINPSEVQTIDVLKDAASAAIYGTRGAGGVILITTKKGEPNTNTISFDANIGVQNLPSGEFTPLLNGPEQIFVDNVSSAAVGGLSIFALLNDTDLTDFAIEDNALIQRYNLRFSGGNKNANYSILGGYFGQEGIVTGAKLDRYSLRANVRVKKNKWSFNSGFGLTIDNNQLVGSFLIRNAIIFSPFLPTIDEVLDFPSNGTARNRISSLLSSLQNKNQRDRYRTDVNSQINYQITPDLQFTTLLGGSFTHQYQSSSNRPFVILGLDGAGGDNFIQGSTTEGVSRNFTVNWNAGLNYKKKFKKNSITATALVSAERQKNTSFALNAQGLLDNGLTGFSNATGPIVATSDLQIQRLINNSFITPDFEITRIGTIARVLYDYDKKYLLNLSARYDGSSQFSESNRWNLFPSASFAWNVSEEEFWKPLKSVVNSFKYRISYGTTGNDRFTSYQDIPTFNTGLNTVFGNSTNLAVGQAQTRLSNPDIKWETTKQFNYGVDLSLLKNKITFTADYYRTSKDDLLLNVIIPPSSGVGLNVGVAAGEATTVINVGDMINEGLEYSLRYRDKVKDFSWDIMGTFTTNNNKVTKLFGNTDIVPLNGAQLVNGDGNSSVLHLVKGFEAGSFLLYRTDGIINDDAELAEYKDATNLNNARKGDLKYVDVNGNGRIDEGDREVRGSGLPEFEAGLNATISYKNFSLTTNWYGSFGNEVLNGSRATAFSERRHRDLLYQWSPTNTNANVPVWRDRSRADLNYAANTDRLLEDGSYIRLNNITFSYKFPKKWLSALALSSASVYVSGQNLVTFTKYSGFDPGTGGNNINRRGVDTSVFPLAKTHNIGFKLKF
ncbi:SusC/RagA family TonB-linked outer membrane protein [Wenyingzhuangia sp. IMCC45533]